jgi:hypothetical protein
MEKYSKTTIGYDHENNDCTVRAFAIALDISYKEAHQYLKSKGRQDGKGIYFRQFIMNNSSYKNFKFVKCFDVFDEPSFVRGGYIKPSMRALTLNFVLNDSVWSEDGTYFIVKNGHVACLKDGIVIDSWKMGGKTKITQVYEVVNK